MNEASLRHRAWTASRCLLITGVCAVAGCSQPAASVPNMVCKISVAAEAACGSVPTISNAVLTLSDQGTFRLEGRYDACYRVEDVTISGTYLASPHSNGVDLELHGERSTGGDPQAGSAKRTVGLVNMGIAPEQGQEVRGRFTDVAAVIRGRGQVSKAPAVPMVCSTN